MPRTPTNRLSHNSLDITELLFPHFHILPTFYIGPITKKAGSSEFRSVNAVLRQENSENAQDCVQGLPLTQADIVTSAIGTNLDLEIFNISKRVPQASREKLTEISIEE